jgi:hypothetical protein
MNHFLADVIVGGVGASLPMMLMLYYFKKFLDVLEQDLHERLNA